MIGPGEAMDGMWILCMEDVTEPDVTELDWVRV